MAETMTFEKVWATIQKDREQTLKYWKQTQKYWEQVQKDREQAQKEREQAQKDREQAQKEREQEREKYREEMREEDRKLREQMKETDRRMGYLSSRFGELAEHLVVPSIKEKFNELNFNFDTVSRNIEISDASKCFTEIDILLENGETVMVVEVKAKPLEKDIDEHINRIEILRRRADNHNDTRHFQGAIAGAIMTDAVRNYIHKKGFYAIEQSGDTVKITIPEGFVPRKW